MHTAIVERVHVGGTCVNEGCTPTKTMVASARVAYLARRGANYGVKTGPIEIDLQRLRERKRDIVNTFRDGSQKRLEQTKKLDLIFGTASFTGPKTLSVRAKNGSERILSAPIRFPSLITSRLWSWTRCRNPSSRWGEDISGSSSARCSGGSEAGSRSCNR